MSKTKDKLNNLMNAEKVIFLDVDGVLNGKFTSDVVPVPHCARYKEPVNYRGIEDGKVNLLRRIVDATGAHIVWSSSWRESENADVMHPYFWNKVGDLRKRFIGQTPRIRGVERGYEIARWLRQNPQVKNFVILDDFDEMLHMKENQVLTNPVTGLTESDAERAIRILQEN